MQDIYLKLPPQVRNYVVSPSSGAFTSPANDGVERDVTGVTLTITTYGRPVLVWLAPDGTTNASGFVSNSTSALAIHRLAGAVDTEIVRPTNTSAGIHTPTQLVKLDVVAAGTYSYRLTYRATTGNTCSYCRLVAWELGT